MTKSVNTWVQGQHWRIKTLDLTKSNLQILHKSLNFENILRLQIVIDFDEFVGFFSLTNLSRIEIGFIGHWDIGS